MSTEIGPTKVYISLESGSERLVVDGTMTLWRELLESLRMGDTRSDGTIGGSLFDDSPAARDFWRSMAIRRDEDDRRRRSPTDERS